MAVLSFLVRLDILFHLDTLVQVTHVEELRILYVQILHHVAPLQTGERGLRLGLISNYHVRLSVLSMFEVLAEHVVLLERHLFVANGAHVVVVTVVDVRPITVPKPLLEGFPGSLRGVLLRHILRSLRLVKDPGSAFDSEMLAQLIEPFDYGAVAGEGAKTNLIEGLLEAEDRQRLLLRQYWLPVLRCLAHLAKQVVPTSCERGNSTRFLVLRPADTVPPVDIEVLPL